MVLAKKSYLLSTEEKKCYLSRHIK